MSEALKSDATVSFPCEECGGMVDLSTEIKVTLKEEADGSEVFTMMPEYEARELLRQQGIPVPPVLCANEERREITMDAISVA